MTRVEAFLHVNGQSKRVVILDFTMHGVKLAVANQLRPGTAVTIEIFGDHIPAIVHWSKSNFAGLHLMSRLELETLDTLEEHELIPSQPAPEADDWPFFR